jgi:hypothetical protein
MFYLNNLCVSIDQPARRAFYSGSARLQVGLEPLFCAPLYFDGRIGPVHSALYHRGPLVEWQKILKGKHYGCLSEKIAVPLNKPDFCVIKIDLVLVGAQNQRELRPDDAMGAKFLLDYGTRRVIDLLCFGGRPFLLSVATNCESILREARGCQHQYGNCKSDSTTHLNLIYFTTHFFD